MRALYLIYHAGNGGSETYVYDMCKELQKRGGTAFLGYGVRGKLVEDLEKCGIECVQIDMPSFHDRAAIKTLKRLIEARRIDIVHAQFSRENYLACFAKLSGAKVKVVYTSHMVNEDGFVKRLLNGFVARCNHAVIAVSEAVRRDLIAGGYPKDRIHLIYNGVDSNCVHKETLRECEDASRDPVRKTLKEAMHKGDILLVNVSRFSHEKGLDYLLEQFHRALQSEPGLQLILIGDGQEKESILEQIERLHLQERVVLTGYQSDPINWISRCHIYVSSSRRESLGYSILEAMSCGLPIVATDVGGCAELVNEKSNCGYLVPFGSDEFSQKIVQLSKDASLREAFGSAAKKYVQEHFTKEVMMDESFRLYQQSTGQDMIK